MCKNNFDFIRGEEAAGTREFAVAEVKVVFVRHGKLVTVSLSILKAFLVVTEGIILFRIVQMIRIMHDRIRGHAEMCADRKLDLIRESNWLLDDAIECHFSLPVR